jgi:hypothetical protein
MRKIYVPLVVGLLFGAPAFAAVTAESVMSAFTAEGYTNIEIRTGADTIKVEATLNDQRVEVIYDSATGDVLKTEAHALGEGDEVSGGPNASGSMDDDQHDDDSSGDDSSAGDDSDDGSDHDMGDDHGGDHGSDDDGGSESDDSDSDS